MGAMLRKYGTATVAGTHLRVPMIVAGAVDFAADGDWTPEAGDVKVSKDGGEQVNIGTLPTYVNGAWQIQLTAAELQAKQLEITVVDSAAKAVEDQCILVETFGHASAMYAGDPFNEATAARMTTLTTGVKVADVDGLTFESVMELLLAVIAGETEIDGDDVIYKKRDGSTGKITISYGETDGERTASVIS